MKYLNFIFFGILFCCNLFGQDIYKFTQFDHHKNITRHGIISLKVQDGFVEIDSDVQGDLSSHVFTNKRKLVEGFNIWDVMDSRDVMGFSVFSPYVGNSQELSVGFETTKVETLDRNNPYLKDQSWVFNTKVISEEKISINEKQVDVIYIKTRAQRPTGPGHCMYGNIGVFYVDSWYSKFDKKLLKQIVDKRDCIPYDFRTQTYEVWEIDNYVIPVEKDKANKKTTLTKEDKLKELKKLKDDELITEETYKKHQEKILSGED